MTPLKKAFLACAATCSAVLLLGLSAGQETLQVSHSRTYSPGDVIDVSGTLNLAQYPGRTLQNVTIVYTSRLRGRSLRWVVNGQTASTSTLLWGRDQEVSLDLNIEITTGLSITAALISDRGGIRVTEVKAELAPAIRQRAQIARVQPRLARRTEVQIQRREETESEQAEEEETEEEAQQTRVQLARFRELRAHVLPDEHRLVSATLPDLSFLRAYIPVAGFASVGKGAGVAMTNLDENPRPEMVLMSFESQPGTHKFSYKIGWNLDAGGIATGWSTSIYPRRISYSAQGAGVAMANIDLNARPEMILLTYLDESHANRFAYIIGWNISDSGSAESWSEPHYIDGVGWEGQGADLVLTNLDGNSGLDMIVMAYDNPEESNNFRYKIGWNLDSNGDAASWSSLISVPGVGWEGQGAGIAITNLDGNDLPELILMAYDNPAGYNSFRYKVGNNLNSSGVAASWTEFVSLVGVGNDGQGAGIAVTNLDADSDPDLILMAYDRSNDGENEFRYRIVSNFTPGPRIHLEMDKLDSVSWPILDIYRGGQHYTLSSIYSAVGFEVTPVHHQGNISDPRTGSRHGQPFTTAEMHSFLTANMNNPPSDSGTWHMYMALLPRMVGGYLGVMFDTGQRRGFAVLVDEFSGYPNRQHFLLRTTAHELGHALNLLHRDGDSCTQQLTGGGYAPASGTGRTIMNQTWSLAPDWGFAWSAPTFFHLFNRTLKYIRPESGEGFGSGR